METSNPISPILNRTAAILAAISMVSTLSASASTDGQDLPSQEQARRSAAVQEAQELLREGDQAYQAGKYADAAEAYAGARELIPDAPVSAALRAATTERYAQAAVEHARALSRKGDVAAAKAVVDKVLLENVAPNHAGALGMRAQLDDPIRTNPALTTEHAKHVDEVRRTLYTAEGALNLGKLDEAKTAYEKVLRLDATNTAARRGLEQVATAQSAYQKSAYDHTRAEMLSQVDAAWETQVSAPDLGNAPADPSTNGPAETSTMTVATKVERLMISKVALDQATLDEALNFLRSRSIEDDVLEADPARKGVNFNLNLGAADSDVSKKILAQKFDLKLHNVPLSQVLKYLTDITHTSFTVDDFAVVITPLGTSTDELITRSYRVPPDFLTSMGNSAAEAAANEDPFAAGEPKKGLLTTRLTAKEALTKQGVPFPDGATASYNSGLLQVTNTALNQDMVSQLVQAAANTQPVMVAVRVTMIKTQDTVLEELGFDTLITPLALNGGDSLFAGGGTVGSGTPRTGGDFATPAIPGIPANPLGTVNSGVLTNGLRSGGYAIDGNHLDSIVNNIDRTTTRNAVAPGIMAVTGLFNDGQVQTIMRGLSQKKAVDVMAKPSTVTRSGQQANISIVREFIYPTEYEPPQIPTSVGSGQSTPVVPATPTAFEKKNVGVTLEVLPVADAEKRYVDITLNPSFSDFDGFVNYGTPINSIQTDLLGQSHQLELTKNAILMPVFSIQRLNTQLTVLDGSTIAIGGLMTESVQNVHDKVPVLGGIPLLGRFFTNEAKQPVKTAIIFLVHVELLDPTGRPYRNR